MLYLIFKNTLETYLSNIKVAVSYLLLLIFMFVFAYLGEFFFNSGTVFLSFEFSTFTIIGLLVGLIFLYVFSFFVSLTIYAVKRDLHSMSFDDYWEKLFKGSALNIFVFYFILTILILGLIIFLPITYALILSFVITVLLMYVPQIIVLDEVDVFTAFFESIDFFSKNVYYSVAVILFSSIVLSMILLFEQFISWFFLANFITIVFVLVFLVPFTEEAKSFIYLMKFDLIRNPTFEHSKIKRKVKEKIEAFRLRQKNPRGKL